MANVVETRSFPYTTHMLDAHSPSAACSFPTQPMHLNEHINAEAIDFYVAIAIVFNSFLFLKTFRRQRDAICTKLTTNKCLLNRK